MQQILVAVEDPKILQCFSEPLPHQMTAPIRAASPDDLMRKIHEKSPEVVVLCTQFSAHSKDGSSLPSDGIAVLRQVRQISDVPVLMVSNLDIPSLRVLALNTGADAYLQRPFSIEILVAEIGALKRRVETGTEVHELFGGDLTVNVASREVAVCSQEQYMTHAEFEVLLALIEAAPRVLTRDHLLQRINPRGGEASDRSVDVHVSNLRKKLAALPEDCIVTVRGEGYRFHGLENRR